MDTNDANGNDANGAAAAARLQALKPGEGIQYLANEALGVLGNPVLIHDMDYKVIAYTQGIVTDDPIWNEFITNGTVKPARIAFYKDESFLDTVANAQKITRLHSDALKYDRIFTKLFNRDNIQIGCAVTVEAYRPFGGDDMRQFEMYCDVLSKELALSEYYTDYGQGYQEALINKLIDRDFEDKEIYTAHVESLYTNQKQYLNIAVADISRSDPTYSKLTYYRDLFKRARPDFKYAVVDKYIVIIMSFDRSDSCIMNRYALKGLDRLFIEEDIYIGISGSFENMFELQRYYAEALQALGNVQQSCGEERIHLYSALEHARD